MTVVESNFNDIFNFDGFDFRRYMAFTFYDVKVTKDFGLLKKGEIYVCVCVDYMSNKIEAFDRDNVTDSPDKEFNFCLTPIVDTSDNEY